MTLPPRPLSQRAQRLPIRPSRTTRATLRGRLAGLTLLLLTGLSIGCGSTEPPELLATTDSVQITTSDLAAYVSALPEAERAIPREGASEWMTGHLERLTLLKHLAARSIEADLDEGQLVWLRASALANALRQSVSASIEVPPEEIEERLQQMDASRQTEPLLNFQHIYLRIDRAGDDRSSKQSLAKRLVDQARSGGDFTALVEQHSDSADAATGGMVLNARGSQLDERSAATLAALEEGAISDVVESRTGLHIFRLVRRTVPAAPADDTLRNNLITAIGREKVTARFAELERELSEAADVDSAAVPLVVGEFSLPASVLERLLPADEAEEVIGSARERIVNELLHANEALERGLSLPDGFEESVARGQETARAELELQKERNRQAEAFDANDLRLYYDAQPAQFQTQTTVDLDLIFLDQGADSFATQVRAEGHVARLRTGEADFAALAREISAGPGAADGGDLGTLAPRELNRLGPMVAAAVGTMEVGEVSDPIYCTGRVLVADPMHLKGGFAILRLRDRDTSRPRSFDEALDDIRTAYAAQHRSELDEALEDELLETAGFRVVRLPEASELAP